MMLDELIIDNMENNNGKKYKKIAYTEGMENNNIGEANEVDVPSYLNDFLQYSKKTIFITGNNNINTNPSPKKIIKRKKKLLNNIKSIDKEKGENEKKNTNEIGIKTNKKKILKPINKSYAKMKDNVNKNIIQKVRKKQEKIENKIKSEAENTRNELEIKANKTKINVNEKSQNLEFSQKMRSFSQCYIIFRKFFINVLKSMIKTVYIYSKIKGQMIASANKIITSYKGYHFRHNIKINYIMYKVLSIRKQKAERINNFVANYMIRLRTKKLLQKAENNYIIYSSIKYENNNILYFKYKHKSGKEEKFYFDYSPLLKCFIFFINKNNDKYLKIVEGNFYDSCSNKLIDKTFEINNNGENIINLPKIFKQADIINDKNDRMINRYLKLHRPCKRMMIDEYEQIKKNSKDDYNIIKNSKTQKLGKIGKISRSKSFLRIKGESKTKSILKPSRSYISLRCGDKKIQFGKAKIKKYKNLKE